MIVMDESRGLCENRSNYQNLTSPAIFWSADHVIARFHTTPGVDRIPVSSVHLGNSAVE